MLCRVHIVACRLIYLIYLMDFSNRIEIWPSAGYLFCFLPDIYLCHQSKHLHFTTMTIYLFLFEGVQFDTVEIYIKNVAQYWKYRKYREGLVGKNIQVYVYLREKTDILCCFRACSNKKDVGVDRVVFAIKETLIMLSDKRRHQQTWYMYLWFKCNLFLYIYWKAETNANPRQHPPNSSQ